MVATSSETAVCGELNGDWRVMLVAPEISRDATEPDTAASRKHTCTHTNARTHMYMHTHNTIIHKRAQTHTHMHARTRTHKKGEKRVISSMREERRGREFQDERGPRCGSTWAGGP